MYRKATNASPDKRKPSSINHLGLYAWPSYRQQGIGSESDAAPAKLAFLLDNIKPDSSLERITLQAAVVSREGVSGVDDDFEEGVTSCSTTSPRRCWSRRKYAPAEIDAISGR